MFKPSRNHHYYHYFFFIVYSGAIPKHQEKRDVSARELSRSVPSQTGAAYRRNHISEGRVTGATIGLDF